MTNNRAKALEALTEWKISRSTGNADLEHEKAKAMSKAVEEALTEPKWKTMDVSEEDLVSAYSPTPVFKEAFIQIVRWLQDKYPNGVKIS